MGSMGPMDSMSLAGSTGPRDLRGGPDAIRFPVCARSREARRPDRVAGLREGGITRPPVPSRLSDIFDLE
jgi:hypothetical protein